MQELTEKATAALRAIRDHVEGKECKKEMNELGKAVNALLLKGMESDRLRRDAQDRYANEVRKNEILWRDAQVLQGGIDSARSLLHTIEPMVKYNASANKPDAYSEWKPSDWAALLGRFNGHLGKDYYRMRMIKSAA